MNKKPGNYKARLNPREKNQLVCQSHSPVMACPLPPGFVSFNRQTSFVSLNSSVVLGVNRGATLTPKELTRPQE